MGGFSLRCGPFKKRRRKATVIVPPPAVDVVAQAEAAETTAVAATAEVVAAACAAYEEDRVTDAALALRSLGPRRSSLDATMRERVAPIARCESELVAFLEDLLVKWVPVYDARGVLVSTDPGHAGGLIRFRAPEQRRTIKRKHIRSIASF